MAGIVCWGFDLTFFWNGWNGFSEMAYLMRFSDFSVFWFSSVGSIWSTSITGYRLFSEMNGMAFRAGLTLSDLFCFLIGFGGVSSEREDICDITLWHFFYSFYFLKWLEWLYNRFVVHSKIISLSDFLAFFHFLKLM